MAEAAYLVTAVGAARGSRAAAAALACAGSGADRAGLLVELAPQRAPRPSLVTSAAARALEERLAAALPEARVAARGRICELAPPPGSDGLAESAAALAAVRDSVGVIHLPPPALRPLLEESRLRPAGAVLRADLGSDRPLAALAAADLMRRGIPVAILKRQPEWLAARLALAGAMGRPAARGLAGDAWRRLVDRVAGGSGSPLGAVAERGQALVMALGGALALIAAALALVAIAGAVTGKGRAQRAADLAAVSAARSMRDDLARLLAPPTLPNGLPNPRHLPKPAYLARAAAAARAAARANGVAPHRLGVRFPDAASFAPLRVRASVRADLELRGGGGVEASAVAEAAAPPAAGAPASAASGGGYGGPLVHRQGEGMRPDVAAAFDRMAAAARRDGVALVVSSGFRSDAEQAALFAANPDPRWVAPPGRSLHRCATELDLGPPSAYGWLAANAPRFDFVRRYGWEPWHFGFVGGPAPCSAAGEAGGRGAGADGRLAGSALPGFVPGRFRAPLLRAASRWNVSAALLAAQLMAESGFDPRARSPAGALGIAQFMPATAAAYGLRDPFDPEQAIAAQARLMSDLLRRFGAPALALAAYNAGPAPVAACGCVPDYPETRAYVSRILALLGGAGAIAPPAFEVRLIA